MIGRALARCSSHPFRRYLGRLYSTPGKLFDDPSSAGKTMVPYIQALNGQNGDLSGIHQAPIEVPMDSYAAVQGLKASGLSDRQAEVLVEAIRWIIKVRLSEFQRTLVSPALCENDLSRLMEIFEDIQSSMASVTARDSVELRSLQDRIGTEIGSLLESAKEATQQTRTDLVLAMASHREGATEENQRMGLSAQQQEARLAVEMGGLRTAWENIKLRSTWMYSVVLCMACVAFAAQAKKSSKSTAKEPQPTCDFIETEPITK